MEQQEKQSEEELFEGDGLAEVDLSQFDGEQGVRTSKLALFWYRIKTFLPELYYASREYYFIQRDKVTVADFGPLGKIHSIEESLYVSMDPKTKEVSYVHYHQHATVFSFFQMILVVWVLNKKYGQKGYEYRATTLGDTAFIHKVKTNEELFSPHHIITPVYVISPVIVIGLSMVALGLAILIGVYAP
jgi:hypothetical protein